MSTLGMSQSKLANVKKFENVLNFRIIFMESFLRFCLGRTAFMFLRNMRFLIVFCVLSQSSTVFSDHVIPSDAVTTSLNVRSSPSGGSRVVAKLFPGQKAEYIATVDDWYEVRLSTGMRGFVSKSWTRIVEEQTADEEPVRDLTREAILSEQVQTLSDSLKKLNDDIDSLTKYIKNLNDEPQRYVPFQEPNMLYIVSILAVALVVIITLFSIRLVHLKRDLREERLKLAEELEHGEDLKVKEGQKDEKMRRRSYFVASSPRLVQTHDTFCSLHINVINSGDNPAISLKTNVYMIDIGTSQATLFKEFHFSTANPIASKQDITFSEENIDFRSECTPKFVLIALDYFDNLLNKKFQQRFSYKWPGVTMGEASKNFEHVDKERSLQLWLKFRELKWERKRSSGM